MSVERKTINGPRSLSQGALYTKTHATVVAWGKKRHFYKLLPTQFRRHGRANIPWAKESVVELSPGQGKLVRRTARR
jgi:hypothetical protein